MSILSSRYFHCEEAAFEHLESIVWAKGVACPHCGSVSGKHYDLRKTRLGLRKCSDCRKQFTVKVGTVFESAHIPLHKMLQAVYLMCASKKGISAHQLHRVLGVTYKSAWFLCHRIREAMRSGNLAPMGGGGGILRPLITMIDHATITGRLYALSEERGGGVKARIWPRNGQRYVACTADADVGPRLGSFFQKAVRAQGRGQWVRSMEGEWACQELHISLIDPVRDGSLRAAIDAVRAINVSWPDDPLAEWELLERDGAA